MEFGAILRGFVSCFALFRTRGRYVTIRDKERQERERGSVARVREYRRSVFELARGKRGYPTEHSKSNLGFDYGILKRLRSIVEVESRLPRTTLSESR